jgi:DNA-binding NtrC family response regulator
LLPGSAEPGEIALAAENADDFVIWPEPQEALRQRILKLLPPTAEEEVHKVSEVLCRELGMANMVGQDPTFLRVAEMAFASAQTAFPVLVTGETGTGKEMLARAIHFFSGRRNRPFVPVDCAGIPDHLFENELFGHARGAYTDAHTEQRGLATLADGGTLFLDEVDSLSLPAQAKLLRFLQDRQFKPLGSERFQGSDVKIIAASNRNLEEQVAEKCFRSDLYYRLNVLHLELPALRERPEDVDRLAQHFLKLYLPAGARKAFSIHALQRLRNYQWPGNARELLNMVQRAIVFSRGPQITVEDLAFPVMAALPANFRHAREANIEVFERDYVSDLLRRNEGNITHAAREAGKERRAFGRLVKKYGLGAQARAAGQN